MAATNNILVVTKNGNFVKAVTSVNKAVNLIRDLLVTDLKMKKAVVADIPVKDVEGVVRLEGTPHYRAKHVTVA